MAKYPQLDDRAWLRERVEQRATAHSIATEAGCGATTVLRALRRHGLLRGELRHGEPPPRPLKPAGVEHADLDAHVARDELAARLEQGLADLAALTEIAMVSSYGRVVGPGGRHRRRDKTWKDAKLERITLHEARHCYASWAIAAVQPLVCSCPLGDE